MRLQLIRHLWGIDLPWEQSFLVIKSLGYAGVETLLPAPEDQDRFVDLLRRHDLQFVVTVHTHGPTVREHLDGLRRQVDRAKNIGSRFVAAQAGRDAFDATEVKTFYAEALKIEADSGLPIAHETHRGRPLFNPWATAAILDQFPSLKLVCDLSHWVCVCERIIDDCLPIIRRVAENAYHIHARVGHSQGAQVPDPRAPEYRDELAAHEHWWDLMWDSQQRRGFTESTMCPEFGPPPYLQTLPHTRSPVANLWDVVDWQSERQRARFAERFGKRT